MKTKNVFVLLLFLVFSSACKEYQITTKINADGTCERIIRIDDYSSNDKLENLPFYVDKSWQSKIEIAKDDTIRKTIIYSKKFANIEELNESISKNAKMKSMIAFDKKFRWFYTYYYYTETYWKNNPFKQIPIEKYLSKKEIDSLSSGPVGEVLSKKVEQLFGKCIIEEYFDSVSTVMKQHSIYDEKKVSELKEKVLSDKFAESEIMNDTKSFLKELEQIYGSKSVWVIKNDLDRILKKIEIKVEDYISPANSTNSFTSSVILPGIILSTNAGSLDGNKLTWKTESTNLVITNYVMKAESRVSNPLIMWATGIVVLVLLVILIIPVFKKKESFQLVLD